MKHSFKNISLWNKVLLLFVFVIVGYYIFVVAIAPLRKLNDFKNEAINDSIYFNQNKEIIKNLELTELLKKKAFFEAQIAIAGNDSINLVVNLNDSTINLMLKGVNIHVSKISKIQKDKFFDVLHPLAFAKIFSKPLILESEFSTIVKEPIVIKKAPKNEEEAIAMATVPEKPALQPGYFSMQLSSGINLILIQNEFISDEEKQVLKKFKKDLRNQKIKNKIDGLLKPQNTNYIPTIVLSLSSEEISSIYRAIPYKANIVITY